MLLKKPLLKWKPSKLPIWLFHVITFTIFYLLITLILVPPLARVTSNRVPLPIYAEQSLKPVNWLTFLANRHYVKPGLKTVCLDIAETFTQKYPNSYLTYLDANFPFFDGFPLIPHLSHDDGNKLDLSFFYQDAKTGEERNGSAGVLGYGVCEQPKPGESNWPEKCARQGHWQYSVLEKWAPAWTHKNWQFDAERTKFMVTLFAKHPDINKLFIEPHLKERLNLQRFSTIRFQGCHSVRHDDHLHIQLNN
jgi:hypothetical protein